ncbi:MAG: hypothetical protein ACUVRS_05715 [Armatimonadota bacterium]
MKQMVRLLILGVICAILCSISIVQAATNRTVFGTFVSFAAGEVIIRTDDDKPLRFKVLPDAIVLRGQLGTQLRKAKLSEIGAGDRIVVVLNEKGVATSLKAYYSIVRGTVATVQSDKIFFGDGSSVKVRPGIPVVFEDGQLGKVADLKSSTQVICRVHPVTKEAWTVVARQPESPKVSIEPYKPNVVLEKPVIKSVTYTAPPIIKPRDWIKVVVTGTPGGRAVCQVRGLIPRTVMSETSPGTYVAHVQVPSDKVVKDEPLVAYLTVKGIDAIPVQASKLISVVTEQPGQLPPVTTEVSTPKPSSGTPELAEAKPPEHPTHSIPAAPEPPVLQSKIEETRPKQPVTITSPATGSKLKRVLAVEGTAEPGWGVVVAVSYTNSMSGVLNLSGQITSQFIAVGADGRFKMGPIPLEGPLATRGLMFVIKAYYPDAPGRASVVMVFGDRN